MKPLMKPCPGTTKKNENVHTQFMLGDFPHVTAYILCEVKSQQISSHLYVCCILLYACSLHIIEYCHDLCSLLSDVRPPSGAAVGTNTHTVAVFSCRYRLLYCVDNVLIVCVQILSRVTSDHPPELQFVQIHNCNAPMYSVSVMYEVCTLLLEKPHYSPPRGGTGNRR